MFNEIENKTVRRRYKSENWVFKKNQRQISYSLVRFLKG